MGRRWSARCNNKKIFIEVNNILEMHNMDKEEEDLFKKFYDCNNN